MIAKPEELWDWTADEVAECLPYHRALRDGESSDLYQKLKDDPRADWWSHLSDRERAAIAHAVHS